MINVHGFRKPTLELELVAGGTLDANTTYYVCGFFAFCPYAYNNISSPLSDIYSITTSSTHRSIRITQKTYRDIQGFTDNGDGKTLVSCQRHCLTTGDIIKIATGSYAGSWPVTRVDYHSFLINTAFIDDTPVQCYTDATVYNKPSVSNAAIGMNYCISKTNPYPSIGNFVKANNWTEPPYQNNMRMYNPVTITSQPSQNPGSGHINMAVNKLDTGIYEDIAKEYGSVFVDVINNTATTFSDIANAVIDAGFKYNSHYSEYGYSKTFDLLGSIRFLGADSSLSAVGTTINIYGEMFHYTAGYEANIQLTNCLINIFPATFSANFLSTANNSVFYNGSNNSGYTRWIFGDNLTLYFGPRQGPSTSECDVPNLTYTDKVTGLSKPYGIVQNKSFKDIGRYSYLQNTYNQTQFINCSLFAIYWILRSEAAGTNPDIYMMENCYIYTTGVASDKRHIFYLGYPLTTGYSHQIDYLNINTDEDDNKKICTNNTQMNMTARFFRRVEFYIKHENTNIEGAAVTITDGSGNEYSGVTNDSGYLYLDVLEQVYHITESDSVETTYNPARNTFYGDFTIRIEKEGYMDEIIRFDSMYGNEDVKVSLNTVPPAIYYQKELKGTVKQLSIIGSVKQYKITGTVTKC